MYVCLRHGISDKKSSQAVRQFHPQSSQQLRKFIPVGNQCGKCIRSARDVIHFVLTQMPEFYVIACFPLFFFTSLYPLPFSF
ncbi:bacterioferritin-associated ferredoxin, partial [Salmonella enterica subsp. enterica serovar Typhimurium]